MHKTIRIRYLDIREDLSEKISGYSIPDGYQTYCIRIRYWNKIYVFVSVIRKNPYIKKFHPNQCSAFSNLDPNGYFPNHITCLHLIHSSVRPIYELRAPTCGPDPSVSRARVLLRWQVDPTCQWPARASLPTLDPLVRFGLGPRPCALRGARTRIRSHGHHGQPMWGLLHWEIAWALGTLPHEYIRERLGRARPFVKRRERGRHREGERFRVAAGNPRLTCAPARIVAPRV
jgi:hypothetical protein